MKRNHRSLLFSLSAILGIALVSGCQQKNSNAVTDENVVTVGNPNTNRTIGDENVRFQVMAKAAFHEAMKKNVLLPASVERATKMLSSVDSGALSDSTAVASAAAQSDLVLGFPIELLGENAVFGAVVTKVSNKTSENMGRLKLSDLTPIHTRAVAGKGKDGNYLFGLVGCFSSCKEGSEESVLLSIPALGVDPAKGTVLVDLGQLGKELNLIEMMDPQGSFTQLKTKSSKTVSFDFSLSTLVFDIETKMIPVGSENEATAPETTFIVRWYLKLTSTFNPAFEPREAVPGVGFFMTERSATPKVQRWARPSVDGGVKYYIKNVPKEFRKPFIASFDEWNERFKLAIGKKLIDYEFLETEDPRYNLVTAGDIRFNVLEWDLDNAAPYGGFGPSIANQHTGEMLSANVLVQGPKIIEGYKKWFEVGEQSDALRAEGKFAKADKLIRDFTVEMEKQAQAATATTFKLQLGKNLAFSIKTQDPAYEDPAFQRADFDAIPKGVSFEEYMHGYFIDLVEHEMGHNLGLRHNFRGNLGAEATPAAGGVSHSVMEYLGRGHRHLDHIGPYDDMAIRYGYAGILPERADLFCTDEDVAAPNESGNSAECSRDDAEKDPYAFFEKRLARGIRLLTLPESTEAPAWTVDDMDRELTISVTGVGLYALSAETTANQWTNFFTGGERPANANGVKEFVLKSLKKQICSTELDTVIGKKATEEAKQKTLINVQTLRNRVKTLLSPMHLYTDAELACQ